jgi:hypothetical protein
MAAQSAAHRDHYQFMHRDKPQTLDASKRNPSACTSRFPLPAMTSPPLSWKPKSLNF